MAAHQIVRVTGSSSPFVSKEQITNADHRGLKKIRQIAITVSDVGSALDFYHDILGLKFISRTGENLAFPSADEIRIMRTTPQGAGTPGAYSILNFAVADVNTIHASLLARGVQDERGPARILPRCQIMNSGLG